jgi:peptide/nickel transport system substrate-binding protein
MNLTMGQAWPLPVYTRRALRLVSLSLALCILLTGSAACARDDVPTSTTGTPTPILSATSAGTSESAPDPGGILRLWWSTRQTLNPLRQTGRSGAAVHDLIFQGLYRIGADESVSPDLALNMAFFENGRLAVIVLRTGITFHDGSVLTAHDVAACLTEILDPARASAWLDGLAAIEQVRVIDDLTLELHLSRSDPWLAWSLTFPILPADRLADGPFALIPGTGRYRMAGYSRENGLSLVLADPDDAKSLAEIQVREYRDQIEAMQALERDELDLVYLDARDLSRYTLRSSLLCETFVGPEQFFVSYHTGKGRKLADPVRLLQIKQILNARWLVGTDAEALGEPNDLGISRTSWLGDGLLDPVAARLSGQTEAETMTTLILIVPQTDTRRTRLATVIAELLAEAGLSCLIRPLSEAAFWTAVSSGDYDLALLSAVLPARPLPGWLYQVPPAEPFTDLAVLPDLPGLEDLALWRGLWQELLPARQLARVSADDLNPDWQAALVETAVRAPWSHLLILYEGLAYGDRVVGHCRPNRFHPYEQIEELWIWSGQSSSSS